MSNMSNNDMHYHNVNNNNDNNAQNWQNTAIARSKVPTNLVIYESERETEYKRWYAFTEELHTLFVENGDDFGDLGYPKDQIDIIAFWMWNDFGIRYVKQALSVGEQFWQRALHNEKNMQYVGAMLIIIKVIEEQRKEKEMEEQKRQMAQVKLEGIIKSKRKRKLPLKSTKSKPITSRNVPKYKAINLVLDDSDSDSDCEIIENPVKQEVLSQQEASSSEPPKKKQKIGNKSNDKNNKTKPKHKMIPNGSTINSIHHKPTLIQTIEAGYPEKHILNLEVKHSKLMTINGTAGTFKVIAIKLNSKQEWKEIYACSESDCIKTAGYGSMRSHAGRNHLKYGKKEQNKGKNASNDNNGDNSNNGDIGNNGNNGINGDG